MSRNCHITLVGVVPLVEGDSTMRNLARLQPARDAPPAALREFRQHPFQGYPAHYKALRFFQYSDIHSETEHISREPSLLGGMKQNGWQRGKIAWPTSLTNVMVFGVPSHAVDWGNICRRQQN